MVYALWWLIYILGRGNKSSAEVTKEKHMFAYKLHFPYSNNEAEFEALVVGVKIAERLGIKRLKVFGDSKFVIK